MGARLGLPLWSSGQLTPDSEQTLISALVGVVLVPLAIPWGYVFTQYVKAPGDRWGKRVAASAPDHDRSERIPVRSLADAGTTDR